MRFAWLTGLFSLPTSALSLPRLMQWLFGYSSLIACLGYVALMPLFKGCLFIVPPVPFAGACAGFIALPIILLTCAIYACCFFCVVRWLPTLSRPAKVICVIVFTVLIAAFISAPLSVFVDMLLGWFPSWPVVLHRFGESFSLSRALAYGLAPMLYAFPYTFVRLIIAIRLTRNAFLRYEAYQAS